MGQSSRQAHDLDYEPVRCASLLRLSSASVMDVPQRSRLPHGHTETAHLSVTAAAEIHTLALDQSSLSHNIFNPFLPSLLPVPL